MRHVIGADSRVFVVGVAFELFLSVLAIGLGALFGLHPLAAVRIESFGSVIQSVSSGLALTLPPFATLILFDRHPPQHFERIKQILNEQILPLFMNCSISQFCLLALSAGIGEEMLFRGFLQDLLAHMIPGVPGMVVSVLLTNLLFGLVHRLTWMYAVWAFAMGLYLSVIYLWTGNLLDAILVHAFYDAFALIYLTRKFEA